MVKRPESTPDGYMFRFVALFPILSLPRPLYPFNGLPLTLHLFQSTISGKEALLFTSNKFQQERVLGGRDRENILNRATHWIDDNSERSGFCPHELILQQATNDPENKAICSSGWSLSFLKSLHSNRPLTSHSSWMSLLPETMVTTCLCQQLSLNLQPDNHS